MKYFLSICAVSLSAVTPLFAYTNILDNGLLQPVTNAWNLTGQPLIVGNSTITNRLVIADAGSVTNGTGIIGNQSGADFNDVFVAGPDASWTMSGDLYVGNTGSVNYLEVSEGGRVTNQNAYVGATAGSSNNVVLIQDGGSRWDVGGTLFIGPGESNAVAVASGGTITASDLVIATNGNRFLLTSGGTFAIDNDFDAGMAGFNWGAGAQLALTGDLTGMGETNGATYLDGGRALTLNGGSWTNGGNDLIVGYASSGSTLWVTNGAFVENADGFIGWGAEASNNLVVVSDEGSAWRNSGNLYIGTYGNSTNLQSAGAGNALVVSNSAWVYVGDVTTNDFDAGSAGGIAVASTSNATLIVDNGSSVETTGGLFIGTTNGLTGTVTVTNSSIITAGSLNIDAGSSFNLDRKGTLVITGDLDVDAQTNLNWNSGGKLEVNGTLGLAGGLQEEGRTLTLDGTNANWTLAGALASGTNGYVTIQGGAAVTHSGAGLVAGSNNVVVVQENGSHWLSNGALTIADTNNQVWVLNGGRITADELVVSNGNHFNLNAGGTLEITGGFDVASQSNLNWNNGGNLAVGGTLSGMKATEIVIGSETNQYTYLSGGKDLTLNGGQWLNGSTNLIVGYNSSGSDLVITNAATVSNGDGYIGWGNGSGLNSVQVTGSGSTWTNSGGHLYVGAYWSGTNLTRTGTGNQLMIEDGAQVFVGEQTTNMPGLLVASTNGAELIVWGGSVDVEDTLYLGQGSATGTNIIYNGGKVTVGDLAIGGGSYLDLMNGGTFAIKTNFNVETAGFNWGEGGHLSVGGQLSNMTTTNLAGTPYGLLNGGRDLTLDGGTWNNAGTNLIIGLDSNGNDLVLKNTGTLTSATTFIGWGTNTSMNSVTVRDGSIWDNSGDLWVGYQGSTNNLSLIAGGMVNVGGNMALGNTNTSFNTVGIDGSNSVLDVAGRLDIGNPNAGVLNLLQIQNGGRVQVGTDVSLYSSNSIGFVSSGTLSIGGDLNVYSNTAITGAGDIIFGANDTLLSFIGDGITLDEDIVFTADSNFANRVAVQDGTFAVSGSVSNQYVGFQTLALNNSTLSGFGTLDAFDTLLMTNGVIAPSADAGRDRAGTLVIDGDFQSSNTVYSAQIIGDSGSDLLHFTGGVDLTGLVAQVTVFQAPTNLTATILTADGGLANNFSSTNIVNNLLLFDASLVRAGNDVNVELEQNRKAFSSSLAYAGTESVRSGFDGMKNAVFTRTKQLRRNLVATAHSIPQEAYLLSNTNAPAGAMGPGDQNTIFDMHVWFQHYNGRGTYDTQGDSRGFDLNHNGTTFGADRLIGEDLTAGFNYTYSRASAKTGDQGSLDTETYWVGGYGEWVSRNGLYVDTLLAYGRSNYDSIRVENKDGRDYLGTGSYRGNEFGGYVDVGQYFYYKNLALAPYAGLHMLTIQTDAYNETDQNGNEQLQVHELNRNIVESAFGMKGRYRFDTGIGRMQATGFAEWTHDFIQEDVYSTLSVNGLVGKNLPPVDMARIEPDADVLTAGLGLSWICTDYMEIGIGYNGRFSESYEEHSGSLMLDLMF